MVKGLYMPDILESTKGSGQVFACSVHAYLHSVLESFGLVKGSLTNAAVHHKDDQIWLNRGRYLSHFLKQCLLLFVPSTGVHNDQVPATLLELVDAILSNLGRICLAVASIEGNASFGGVLFQLVKGSSSEGISAHHGWLEVLPLVEVCILHTGGGLSAPLQTDKHDHVRFALLGFLCLGVLVLGIDATVEHSAKLIKDRLLDNLALVQASPSV